MVAGYPSSYIGLPKGTITHLWLDHMSIKWALEVIKDSPCLKQCTIGIIDTNKLAELPSVMAHTLETLKVFGFNMYIEHFFSHLITPVLRNLALHLLGVPLAPHPGLIPFLSCCGSLISLRLSGASGTSDMLLELLQAMPKLCHFVDDLALLNGEDVHHILELTRTRNLPASNPILPSLHSLLLERVHSNRNWANFASMLCSRWKNTPGTSSSPIAQLDMVVINVEGVSLRCSKGLATFWQLSEEGMDIVLKDSTGSHDFGALSVLHA